MATTSPRLTQRVCPLKVGKQCADCQCGRSSKFTIAMPTVSPLRSGARVEGVEGGEQGASDLIIAASDPPSAGGA